MTVAADKVRKHAIAYAAPLVQHGLDYAYDVIEGKVLACEWVKLACSRFIKDLDRCEQENSEMIFSQARAQHVLDFARKYGVHVKGKRWRGKPVDLMDFHIFFLINVFGFVRPLKDEITGENVLDFSGEKIYVRRFRTAIFYVARKNAKSFLASIVALYLLFGDDEGGSEVYSAATTKDQAKIVFDDAKEMVQTSKALNSVLKTTKKSIYHEPSYSKFVPLSSDVDSLDGLNVHGGIIDEIHAHKKRDLYDVIETATGARDQSLLFVLSTAGVILDGICVELKNYGQRVLKCVDEDDNDDSFFFIWYTMDEKDLVDEEAILKNSDSWFKANPGMGICKSIENMKDLAKKALSELSARANFKTKHLNVFVNGASAWMNMSKWLLNTKSDKLKAKGLPFVVGVDLSEKIDLCAASKTYYAPNGDMCFYLKLWLPEGRLKTCSKEMKQRYDRWVTLGLLKLTEGDAVDIETVKSDIYEWVKDEQDKMTELAYDPWHATQFAISCAERYGWRVVEVPQNTRNLNEAMKKIEELTFLKRFFPVNSIAFDWMISNVQVTRDKNGNIFPDKSSRENKIDGPASLFTAVSRIIRNTGGPVIPDLPDDMGTI